MSVSSNGWPGFGDRLASLYRPSPISTAYSPSAYTQPDSSVQSFPSYAPAPSGGGSSMFGGDPPVTFLTGGGSRVPNHRSSVKPPSAMRKSSVSAPTAPIASSNPTADTISRLSEGRIDSITERNRLANEKIDAPPESSVSGFSKWIPSIFSTKKRATFSEAEPTSISYSSAAAPSSLRNGHQPLGGGYLGQWASDPYSGAYGLPGSHGPTQFGNTNQYYDPSQSNQLHPGLSTPDYTHLGQGTGHQSSPGGIQYEMYTNPDGTLYFWPTGTGPTAPTAPTSSHFTGPQFNHLNPLSVASYLPTVLSIVAAPSRGVSEFTPWSCPSGTGLSSFTEQPKTVQHQFGDGITIQTDYGTIVTPMSNVPAANFDVEAFEILMDHEKRGAYVKTLVDDGKLREDASMESVLSALATHWDELLNPTVMTYAERRRAEMLKGMEWANKKRSEGMPSTTDKERSALTHPNVRSGLPSTMTVTDARGTESNIPYSIVSHAASGYKDPIFSTDFLQSPSFKSGNSIAFVVTEGDRNAPLRTRNRCTIASLGAGGDPSNVRDYKLSTQQE